MIEIVAASPAHIGSLSLRLRAIDQVECRMFGRSSKQSLRLAIQASTVAWTGKVNGRPEAMFGISPVCTLTGIGSPWMLCTDEAVRHQRAMLVMARAYVDRMLSIFPVLTNHVHAENDVAIRWLCRLGFTVGQVSVISDEPMREFVRIRGDG